MLRNYIAIAIRNLKNRPGYTLINISGLAIGMTAFFLITLFIRDEFAYDRYHQYADRTYRIALEGSTNNGPLHTAMTAPSWAPFFEAEIPEIERAVRIKPPNQMWLVANGERKFFERGFVFADSTVFDVFDFDIRQGATDKLLAAPLSVILSESMARKYFGNEDPLGKTLMLDALYEFTVTGVMGDMPPQSHFHADFLASMSTLRSDIYGQNFLDIPLFPQLYTYVLARPETRSEVIEQKIDDLIERTYGQQLDAAGVAISPFLQPITDIHLHSNLDAEIAPTANMSTVLALSAIAVFILLIACINYMNLATARSSGRAREVGMRKVLGAERVHLVRQFLGESIAMAGFSVILALVLLILALPAFNALTAKSLSILSAGLLPSILVVLAIVVVAGILAGSYPAVFLSSFKPVDVLKGSSNQGTGSSWLRRSLVVFQFATSIAMIAATFVVYNQLRFMRDTDLGFDRENTIIVQLTDPRIRNEYQTLRTQVAALGSVKSVSASNSAPGYLVQDTFIRPEGVAVDEQTFVQAFLVDYDFEETLGLDVIAGRSLSRDHPADTLGAFILNEQAIASMGLAPAEDAIGRTLVFGNIHGPLIGVVKDFHAESMHQSIEPAMIMMINQQAFQYLYIHTVAGQTRQAVEDVGRIWNTLYPAYVYQHTFLDDDIDALYAADIQLGKLFAGFALLTIVVACLGLFGLASFTAEQRTKEIGIRKVLGASVLSVVLLLIREFTLYVVIAFAIASPLVWMGMQRWLNTFVYHSRFGIGTLTLVGVLALLIAVVTVLYQSIRAATSNPVDSLRSE